MHVVGYTVNHPDIMAMVGDNKILKTMTLETKLQKGRSRAMNLHKQLRGGSCTKLENTTAHVLLFENETTCF